MNGMSRTRRSSTRRAHRAGLVAVVAIAAGIAAAASTGSGCRCDSASPNATGEGDDPVAAAPRDAARTGPRADGASAGATARNGAAGAAHDADAARAPATPAEVAKRRAYLAALAKGRRATAAKDSTTALAAFDEAIRIDPLDARAYAERGYARFAAAGDLDEASRDLDRAAARTEDAALLAQIWWNHGLVDEQARHADDALFDFFLANRLRPSAAAAKKIAGRKVCPARVVAAPADPGGGRALLLDAADWLGVANAAASPDDDVDARPKTAYDARLALTGASADPALPTIATAGAAGRGRRAYVVARHASGLRAVLVGAEWGARCPGNVAFEVVRARGDLVHVRGSEQQEGGYTIFCLAADSGVHPCSSEEYEDANTPKQSGCAGGPTTPRDVVVDMALGRVVATVERVPLHDVADASAALARVDTQLVDAGLALSGLDCDRVVPFARDGGASP